MTRLTRRYRFAASHRLDVAAFDSATNRLLFGKCNNPFGHGHDYALSVTIAGPVDAVTGLVIDVARLDRVVEDEILRRFAYRNLNVDLEEFRELVPTTENVALVIAELLDERWGETFPEGAAKLQMVHVQETDRNGFAVDLAAQSHRPWLVRATESVGHAAHV